MADLPGSNPSLADIRAVLLKALGQSHEPLPPNRLRELLTGPYRLSAESLSELLEGLVAEGQLFRHSPYRTRQPRYGTQTPEAYAGQVLERLLAERPHTWSDLQKRSASQLADFSAKQRKQLLDQLIQQGRVLQLPGMGSSKAARFSVHPPDPAEYLAAMVKRFARQVDTLAGKLHEVGVEKQASIAAAHRLLAEQLSKLLPAARPPDIEPAPRPASEPASEPVSSRNGQSPPDFLSQSDSDSRLQPEPESPPRAEAGAVAAARQRVLDQLAELAMRLPSGPLVPVRRLRQELQTTLPGKVEFDELLLDLARRGDLALYRHDYPAGATEAERQGYVRDPSGNYYNGVSLKRSAVGGVDRGGTT